MDLRTYLKTLPRDQREAFSTACETSVGHLNNVAGGFRPCATDLAVLIERHSGGAVTRQELRADWPRHWPELVGTEGAPAIPATQLEMRDAA